MTTTRRHFLGALLATPLALRATGADVEPVPTTGEAVAGMEPFDELMVRFLEEQKVPGAAIAVAKEGKLVYARGFGYADPDRKVKVEPTSLFRISSVSKTLTGAATIKLVEQGKLNLDDKVLDVLAVQPTRGMDGRWKQITVAHLLQHTGGWDRDKTPEITGRPIDVANALRVPLPVTATHMVRYLLSRPLDFDPGSKFVYANPGYLVLGRIVEAVTKGSYAAYVRKEILTPLGITATQIGRELPENRARGEVRYFDRKKQRGPCLYPQRRGQQVPIMDGAFNFEAMDSFSGWISSAVDLVRFASAFDDREKCPILKPKSIELLWSRPEGAAGNDGDQPKPAYYNGGWSYRPIRDGKGNAWHEGMMPGACTLLMHTFVNVSWAILFNMDQATNGSPLSTVIDPLVGQAAQKVMQWPDRDLFPKYLK